MPIFSTKLEPFLTHFQPMFHFYTPWKHQKTEGFFVMEKSYEYETLRKNFLNLQLPTETYLKQY